MHFTKKIYGNLALIVWVVTSTRLIQSASVICDPSMTFIALQSHSKQTSAVLKPTGDNELRKGVALLRMAL